MHYYLYEIRNNINGKIYIGVHKTKVLDDGYMGSGKVIKSAIAKYGIENFTKTILEIFETQEEMFAKEKEIVSEEFLAREDTYNLRRGGLGGFDYINSTLEKYKESRSNGGIKGRQRILEIYGRPNVHFFTQEDRNAAIDVLREKKVGAFYNKEMRDLSNQKSQTAEARNKRKETLNKIEHQQGEKNSQHGTMWITNGLENKKIKKDELIPEGWNKGRKIKLDNASIIQ